MFNTFLKKGAALLSTAGILASLSGTSALAQNFAMDDKGLSVNPDVLPEGPLPIVLDPKTPVTYPVSDKLKDFTRNTIKSTDLVKVGRLNGEDDTHCATISGSDDGWDDSDCM